MSKYNSKKVSYQWLVFDSNVEMDYYRLLETMLVKKEISWIVIQPEYILTPSFEKNWIKYRPVKYIADFEYLDKKWVKKVVDIKWMATAEAKMKRKLFNFFYRDIELLRLVKFKWEWVDYDLNEKRKSFNRREKKKIKLS